MTTEELQAVESRVKRGSELLCRLKRLEEAKKNAEKAVHFATHFANAASLSPRVFFADGTTSLKIDGYWSLINLDDVNDELHEAMKYAVLQRLHDLIARAQQEFDEL